jgi:hypothetical protein
MGGPEVGEDLPITNPPRKELKPGVLAPPEQPAESPDQPESTEEREVRAADPGLSEETNLRLTEELREVVGEERVEVPADRPHATQGEQPRRQRAGAYLSMHRFQLLRITAIVLTLGGIIALITRDWWLLPLAAGLHAIGTMIVTLTAVRMTTTVERASPQLAAAMSEEGVRSPDERFSEMVEEFRPAPDRGTSEVLSSGFNERTAEAADSAAADVQQSSAMTPSAGASTAEGEGAFPDVFQWGIAAALLALSVVLPAVTGGGWMWLLTAVMVPLLAAWLVLQRLLRTQRLRLRRGSLIAVVVCTAAAVAGFCAVVALAFQ